MSRKRDARRIGRARLHRIGMDHARTGDDTRAHAAYTAALGKGERSPTPSNWDTVITRGVKVWREVYKHLARRGINLWDPRIERETSRYVEIDGARIDLHAVARLVRDAVSQEDFERDQQLAFHRLNAVGDTWYAPIAD